MKRKLWPKVICLVCLLSTLLCSCNDVHKEPSQPICVLYDDFLCYDEQELINASKDIIVGTVTKIEILYNKKEDDNEQLKRGTPQQFSHITVLHSLRGTVPNNKEIVVPLDGDGKTYIVSNINRVGGYFEKGDRVLLFLNKRSEETWSSMKEHYPKYYQKTKKFKKTLRVPISYYQSIYRLDEEGNILHERNNSNMGLFTDCATVDELAEKYNLN